jgi:hypothetical protein
MLVRDIKPPAPPAPLARPRRIALIGLMAGVVRGAVNGALFFAVVAVAFCLFSWDSAEVSLQDDFLPLVFLGACVGAVPGAVLGGARSRGNDPCKGSIVGAGALAALGSVAGALAGSGGQSVLLTDGALLGAVAGALLLLRKRGMAGRLLGTLVGALAGLLIGILLNSWYHPNPEQINEIVTWSWRVGAGAGAFLGVGLVLQGWLRWGALAGAVAGGLALASGGKSVAALWTSLEPEAGPSRLEHGLVIVGAWAGISIGCMLGAALIRCFLPRKTA